MEFWEFVVLFIVIIIGALIRFAFTKADKDKINYLQGENNRLKGDNEMYDSNGKRL